MLDQEQDHDRCRELRRIDDEIKRQIAANTANSNRERNLILQLRSERAPLQSRLFDLQRTQAVSNSVSLTPGKPNRLGSPNLIGEIGGAVDLVSVAQLADIEEKIRSINNKIKNSQETIRRLQNEYDGWLSSERRNARKLHDLNCVMP